MLKKIQLIILFLICFWLPSKATHIFGGELTYEYVSGNTYRINLTLYADCAQKFKPLPNLISNLYNATPKIYYYNGNTFIDSFNLALVPGSGVEVSPVCPGQLSNTTCNSTTGTLQGVLQFKYTALKNLGSASANWKFMFWGDENISGNITGRSSNITNIIGSPCTTNSTVMSLEAKLNNLNAPNNSVNFTVIPTPYHCIYKNQSYNQGAVDIDGDSLTFQLVDGIDGNAKTMPISCFVTYASPLSAVDPLLYTAGTFNFSSSTGQLNYQPNFTQDALVVVKVTEYRNGIIVGSTMREMTFIVIPNCNNSPPGGVISTSSSGYIDSFTNIYVCQNAANLTFTIPVKDTDVTNNVTVTYSGLPSGATLIVTNNNTNTPTITGTYLPIGGYLLGNFTFFVTYTDDGCPLISKQTIAYTIHVIPPPQAVTTVVQPTCANGALGSILITASSGKPAYLYSDGGIYGSSNLFNSLVPATYLISVRDAQGCIYSTNITLIQPPVPIINSIVKTTASCVPGCDASVSITATTPSATALSYSITNGTTFQSSNAFGNLCVGNYTIVVKDANNCSTSSLLNIVAPPGPTINSLTNVNASCVPGCDGQLANINTTSSVGGVQFNINGGTFQTSNSFLNLCANTYIIIAKDANGCTNSSVSVVQSQPNPVISNISFTKASCVPGCDGSFTITASASNLATINYTNNGGTPQVNNIFSNLCVGVYTILVTDSKGCTASSIANLLKEPNPTIKTNSSNNISCYGKADGKINVVAVGNGTINYLLNPNNITNTTGSFSSLPPNLYTVTMTDSKGCFITSTYNITQPSILAIDSVVKHDKTCPMNNNGFIYVYVQGGSDPKIFTLSNGLVNNNGHFNNLNSGSYSVSIVDANGCSLETTANILPPVDPLEIVTTYQEIACNGTSTDGWAKVTASHGKQPYTYYWNTNPASKTDYISGLYAGVFIVDVTDADGCVLSDTVELKDPEYCCTKVFIPNAFSPNEDGINDKLEIKTATLLLNQTFLVFDRWGNKVFETKDISDSWNGEYNKQQQGDVSTYFYLLKYKCAVNNKDYIKTGDVILVK